MGIVDWFVNGFGAAVTDIRQKVVEEPWFGRPVTPVVGRIEHSLAEGLGWAKSGERDGARAEQDQVKEVDRVAEPPEHDRSVDLDR